MRVSKIIIIINMIRGNAKPFITPDIIIEWALGEMGVSLPPAGSNTRASISVVACARMFSSRLLSR